MIPPLNLKYLQKIFDELEEVFGIMVVERNDALSLS